VLKVDGQYECFVLEDKFREPDTWSKVSDWKVQNSTAIPKGRYNVTIDYSNHFKKNMLHVLDVPGFEGIRIHSGNTDADTEGCLLVGRTRKEGFIGESRIALDRLISKVQLVLAIGDTVTLIIS
jgi:hypothetical protein